MSLFPDPQKQGEIQFLIAKETPYLSRIKLLIGLMTCGLILELFVHFWLGLIFIATATILSLVKGYHINPVLKSASEKWSQVTPDEFKKVIDKQNDLKKWDVDFFDISNPLGLCTFLGLAIFFGFIWFKLEINYSHPTAKYWFINALVIVAPHWFSGIRTYLKKDRLIIKIKILQRIMETLKIPSDIQVLPMLSTKDSKDGGNVPVDVRLMLRFLNATDYFLGMQIQISINAVQGKDYPYLYCVLIAKETEKFFHKRNHLIKSHLYNILIEDSKSDDVDVLVIRQKTTKTSGYYTNMSVAKSIVNTALTLALKLIES